MANNQINLSALQQQDPYITDIMTMATNVQLYNFDMIVKNEWDKTNIRGPLFVYKRSACPVYGLMILNSKALENWVEPITQHLEFQLQSPFLLYRSITHNRIQCIWFHNPAECKEVGELMQSLRDEVSQVSEEVGGQSKASKKDGANIMQILSGAQQRYESKTKGGSEPLAMTASSSSSGPMLIKPKPVKGDGSGGIDGPTQLQELFKTVKLTQALFNRPGDSQDTGDPPPDVTINPLHRSLSVSEVESRSAPSGGLTVAEIEQRHGAGVGVMGAVSQSPVTRELLTLIAATAGEAQGSTLPAMPRIPSGSLEESLRHSPSAPSKDSELLLRPGDFEKQASTALKEGSGSLGAACPDVLLTPMAFATPPRLPPGSTSPISSATGGLDQPGGACGESPQPGFASPPPLPPSLNPLTRQQLQQALLHVIRTDEDFVGRLHEAYLSSFRQQLGSSSSGTGKR